MARRYSVGSAPAPSGLTRPPRCSFAHGAAGVAYFLHRYGVLAGNRRALHDATEWIALAERDLHVAGAFVVSAESRVFPDPRRPPPLPSSLYFGEAGVWCVAALVRAAVDDASGADRALDRFIPIADACPPEALDAVAGAASLLLGTALLVEELGDPSSRRLLPVGTRLADRLIAAAAEPFQSGFEPLESLGAAHGWCGIAHALLRWCQATGAKPSSELRELLGRLMTARLPSGLWPRRLDSDEVWPGWCHGSAGWAQLWTLAFELLGDEDVLVLAGRPAAHAVGGGGGAGLCCGLAGQAYAALAVYRLTGLPGWLEHSRRLTAEACRTPPGPDFPEHSLWRGDLGAALLAAEVERPMSAAMPLYRALS